MMKFGVLCGGGGTNLQAIIDAVKSGVIKNAEISFVISNNADAYALERARNNGITAVCLPSKELKGDFNAKLIDKIAEFDVELIVLAGFMKMIPAELCKKYKIINIHPSLIPSFCGAGFYGLKVHEAVLEKGVKVTGATVHFVDGEYDHGPIILQKAVEVKYGDTPEILQKRVMEEAEWKLLPAAVDLIANGKVLVDENGIVKIV